jgi:trehalose-6-phosphate synthase
MKRKCIIQERQNSFETLERYPESQDKIIYLETVAQSVRSRTKEKMRNKTLKLITAELAKRGRSSNNGTDGSNMQVC